MGRVKRYFVTAPVIALVTVFMVAGSVSTYADDDVTIVAPTSEAADGLDLQAVGELFKDAKNLEAFEKALNDPETGINNLDLDENGEVDYVRVVDEAAEGTHVIILQAALGEDEFQDVATIEVEKEGEENYNMQVRGDVVIYGADYYYAPAHVHVHTWPIVTWMYRPVYRPYRSPYHWGVYPRGWRPYHPVHVNVYRTRTVTYTKRASFTVTRTSRVKTVSKVNYRSRTSTRVTKKTRVKSTTKASARKTTAAKSAKAKKGKQSGAKSSAKSAGKSAKKNGKGQAKAKKGASKKKKASAKKGGRKKGSKKKAGKKKGGKKKGGNPPN